MKLHLDIPCFHIVHNEPKKIEFFISIPKLHKKHNSNNKKKHHLSNLSPTHWYDGVWDNLDYTM